MTPENYKSILQHASLMARSKLTKSERLETAYGIVMAAHEKAHAKQQKQYIGNGKSGHSDAKLDWMDKVYGALGYDWRTIETIMRVSEVPANLLSQDLKDLKQAGRAQFKRLGSHVASRTVWRRVQ